MSAYVAFLTQIWTIHPNIPSPAALAAAGASGTPVHPPRAEYAATLSRHTGVVNVVRFSPAGDVLASAGDDGTVLFWVRSDQMRPSFGESQFGADGEALYEKESWRVRIMTRATSQELYDMAWSPDGESVLVGGTDFAARIINAADGTVTREISEHQHYVQGVAWDPLNQFLATQSSDRAVHLYNLVRGHNDTIRDVQIASRHAKVDVAGSDKDERASESDAKPSTRESTPMPAPSPAPTDSTHAQSLGAPPTPSRSPSAASGRSASPAPLPSIRAPPSPRERMLGAPTAPGASALKLYGDDRYSSFFRRLAFSPDGALLATPTGQYAPPSASEQRAGQSSAVYLYGRGNFARSHAPIAALPGHKSVTLVVRFSPILYRLRHRAEAAPPMPDVPPEPGHVREASLATAAATSAFSLPYRMVYAIATQESVWVYDTQQAAPLCCFSNLHYASFTDLSWSPDGQLLMMSSSDGYCSVAVFDYNELGRPYNYTLQPSLRRAPRAEASIPQEAEHAGHAASHAASAPAPQAAQPAAQPSAEPSHAPPPELEAKKKKRRVALTFEGPLQS